MIYGLSKYETKVTNGSTDVSFKAIGNTNVKILCGGYSHFISVNTTTTTGSVLLPVNVPMEFEINPGDVIHALSHAGAGSVTVIY
jgi:heme/copper-type cytochrome/quinol oxidase subunit 2